MKYITIATAIVLALAILSCEGPTSSERYDEDYYYIIAGALMEGQPMSLDNAIYVGRTIKPGSDILDAFIDDADVTIYDDEGNSYPLEFGFNFGNDLDSLKIGYFNEDLIPEAEHTYRIELCVPTAQDSTIIDTVWAETTVPKTISIDLGTAFTTNPDSVDNYQLAWETAGSEHPLIIETSDAEPVVIYSKFYCLEEWNTVRMVKPIFGQDTFDEEVDYDDPSNHYPRLLSDFGEFLPDANGNGYSVSYSFYQALLVFYGGYEIKIHSIDQNFYKYLYKPESNYQYGGVHGGYGYFGSVCGVTIYTTVVEAVQ